MLHKNESGLKFNPKEKKETNRFDNIDVRGWLEMGLRTSVFCFRLPTFKNMTNTDKLKLSQNVAVIAGIFCITVALLLLLNFWQVSKNDPIESKALKALVERLSDDAN